MCVLRSAVIVVITYLASATASSCDGPALDSVSYRCATSNECGVGWFCIGGACRSEPLNDITDSSGPVTVTTTSETTNLDVVVETDADPCTPNPCTEQPAPVCEDDAVVTYAANGTCVTVADTVECTYTPTSTQCGSDHVCAAGECVLTGDPCSYTFSERVSYVSSIRIANQDSDDTCCFDYTGDGIEDNSLGEGLVKTTSALLGQDLNATIQDLISAGTLTLLLETKGVEDLANDTSIDISGFDGQDGDADLSNNAAGMSAYSVSTSAFQPGTAIPIIRFSGASITGGVLTAGPGAFRLSLPLFGAPLDLVVSFTRVEGAVALGPNGQGLTIGAGAARGAKLSGVVRRADFYAALNSFIGTCGCVEFSDPADTQLIGDDGQCNVATTRDCTEDDGACGQLPALCGPLVGFIDFDVDMACLRSGAYDASDCTGERDAISIGLWLKATSGTIERVVECTP